jgi:hypothetical protein
MILKKMFIYFVITNYMAVWCGGQMVKTLGCGWKGEGSNLILNMLFYDIIITNPTHQTQNIYFSNNIIMGQMCLLSFSIVQFGIF